VCSVCGELHPEQKLQLIGASTAEEAVIRTNLRCLAVGLRMPVPGQEMPAADSMQDVPLAKKGIRADGSLQMCRTCFLFLRRCEMPPRALANDLDFGDIPVELQDLTIPEQTLISRLRCKMNILKVLFSETCSVIRFSFLLVSVHLWCCWHPSAWHERTFGRFPAGSASYFFFSLTCSFRAGCL